MFYHSNSKGTKCQMVSTKNIDASNIIWTKQVIFSNIYVYTTYTYMHIITVREKETINLKKSNLTRTKLRSFVLILLAKEIFK